VGTQFGIEKDQVALLKPYFDLVYCKMMPGSVLFSIAILIHASEANRSKQHRRSFITAYTALGNPQIKGQLCADEVCPVGTPDAISTLLQNKF
jgi:ectoine hydroxylase-related dioxygenase (phytanoyl-CoA dioxygenase family)